MRYRSTDWIDVFIGDGEIDVGAFWRKRIIRRKSQLTTSLPPSIWCADDLRMQRVVVGRPKPDLPGRGLDIYPFAIANAEPCRCLWVDFDKGLLNFIAQTRNVAVLLVDKLNHTERR